MKPLRILVVDDDQDFAESMGELIELEGHQSVLAYNGIEALEIFKQNNIDIILVDFKMPGINGIETLLEIRKLNSTVPVFMMTAFANKKLINDAKKQGVIEVLDKPLDINELVKIFSGINGLRNILLLDDDRDFANSLSKALIDAGYNVYNAYNTEQAVNYIKENNMQLLILDLRINGKTGIDVWYSIRNIHPDIPTIFITGYADQFLNQIDEIMQSSHIDVLKKPFSPDELIHKIQYINSR